MKNYIFAMMAFLTSFIASAQGNWGGDQNRNTKMQPIGLMAGLNGSIIGSRPGLSSISEGDINLGIFIGRRPLSFLMFGGSSSHSEVVNYITPDIDPVCGCYQETTIKEFQNRLRINYFQAGFSYQKKGTAIYLTGGVASVQRSYPVIDSLGGLQMQTLSLKTLPMVSFSVKTIVGRDLLSVQGTGVADINYPIGKGSISYLLRFNAQENLFGGLRAGYISHEVSGHEFSFGPEFLFGSNDMFVDISLSFGGSYNPNPNEGFGLYISGAINLTRQNRSLFQ